MECPLQPVLQTKNCSVQAAAIPSPLLSVDIWPDDEHIWVTSLTPSLHPSLQKSCIPEYRDTSGLMLQNSFKMWMPVSYSTPKNKSHTVSAMFRAPSVKNILCGGREGDLFLAI